jgi:CheY-like chemotaxis protein
MFQESFSAMSQSVCPHILLVNGDPTLQGLRRLMLRQRGYHVESVHTLDEALSLLAAAGYSLVMVDAGYDPTEAIEFCEQVKKLNPAQKVALLANHTLYLPSQACPDEVLSKQDGPEQFLTSVDQLIQQA